MRRHQFIVSVAAIIAEQAAIYLIPAIGFWRLLIYFGVSHMVAPLIALTVAAFIWALLWTAIECEDMD